MGSLEFFIDLILLAALWAGVEWASKRKSTKMIY